MKFLITGDLTEETVRLLRLTPTNQTVAYILSGHSVYRVTNHSNLEDLIEQPSLYLVDRETKLMVIELLRLINQRLERYGTELRQEYFKDKDYLQMSGKST